ncbi:hypothetical protein C8R44DRAFT_846181 [Mycena epipterygia]|nr:hypothetical protein C8R44DRAFT_846181 [Mycena epipterygia]
MEQNSIDKATRDGHNIRKSSPRLHGEQRYQYESRGAYERSQRAQSGTHRRNRKSERSQRVTIAQSQRFKPSQRRNTTPGVREFCPVTALATTEQVRANAEIAKSKVGTQTGEGKERPADGQTPAKTGHEKGHPQRTQKAPAQTAQRTAHQERRRKSATDRGWNTQDREGIGCGTGYRTLGNGGGRRYGATTRTRREGQAGPPHTQRGSGRRVRRVALSARGSCGALRNVSLRRSTKEGRGNVLSPPMSASTGPAQEPAEKALLEAAHGGHGRGPWGAWSRRRLGG